MREGTLDAAFGFGLAEGGYAFLWVSRGGGLLRQESAIPPNLCNIEIKNYFLSRQMMSLEFAYWWWQAAEPPLWFGNTIVCALLVSFQPFLLLFTTTSWKAWSRKEENIQEII